MTILFLGHYYIILVILSMTILFLSHWYYLRRKSNRLAICRYTPVVEKLIVARGVYTIFRRGWATTWSPVWRMDRMKGTQSVKDRDVLYRLIVRCSVTHGVVETVCIRYFSLVQSVAVWRLWKCGVVSCTQCFFLSTTCSFLETLSSGSSWNANWGTRLGYGYTLANIGIDLVGPSSRNKQSGNL